MIIPVLMCGYSRKFCYWVFVFFVLVIMTVELCLCSAGVFTSCYMPVEGQCFINIQRQIFGMCLRSGAIGCYIYILNCSTKNFFILLILSIFCTFISIIL
jgi:hypothetical protein